MTKILVVSNDGVPDGYGRISMSLNTHLVKRGIQVFAVSLAYDGLLPPMYDGQPLPYWVGSMGGHPNWIEQAAAVINSIQPDIVVVIQDFPYLESVRNLPLDWSRMKFIGITPVDGFPIWKNWITTAKKADAMMTISQFGVDAFRKSGVEVGLCQPGIDPDTFFPLAETRRAELRAKLNIAPDAFVLGVMCQHQGRKSIPQMMKAFFDFAQGRPTARLLLDMDRVSSAGWDIETMICAPNGWDTSQIIWRDQCVLAGITSLNDRYNMLDAHAVLAFREGWGLPLVEAMATGVVSIAQDYCSGTEIVGDNKGILIPSVDYFMPSTWGGAMDMLPDYRVMTQKLQWLCDNPEERKAMAKRGMEWARKQLWSVSVDNVATTIERVLSGRRGENVVQLPQVMTPTAIVNPSPDGVVKDVQLVEVIS